MPIIHVHYISDLTQEQKRKLTADMTEAAAKNMNLPPEYVQIWLHQTSAEDHSLGGVLISDKLKKEGN